MAGAWPEEELGAGKGKDSATSGEGDEQGWPGAILVLRSQGHLTAVAVSVLCLIRCIAENRS